MRFFLILAFIFISGNINAGGSIQERYERFAQGLHSVADGEILRELALALEQAIEEKTSIYKAFDAIWDYWRGLEASDEVAATLIKEAWDYCEMQFRSLCEQPSDLQPKWLAQETRGIAEALIKFQQSV